MNRRSILSLISLLLVLTVSGCSQVLARSQGATAVPAHSQTPPAENPVSSPEPQASLTPGVDPTLTATPDADSPPVFDAARAYQDVVEQVDLGARVPGTDAHQAFIDWAQAKLSNAGWDVEVRESTVMGHTARNILARRFASVGLPVVVFGAHYDSRMIADRNPDPSLRDQPVPGANDGASGVAVLLELARVLPDDLDADVWLVLFDLEDQGNIPGYDWSLGAQGFVQGLEVTPAAAIIVDMIGDADLHLYKEGNSNRALNDEIWSQAQALGYDQFIDEYGSHIIDDHVPFLQAGIPAIDIIDINYDYWHTVADTPDKVTPESLEAVGATLVAWIVDKY